MKIEQPLDTEIKLAKKEWLKPEIMLLATGYVEGGAANGHYEGNKSSQLAASTWNLHTPLGAAVQKTNATKNHYIS